MKIYQAKGATLEEQYFDIGALFSESIRKSVKSIARRRARQSQIRKMMAERTLANLQGKKSAQEFLLCLESWARGAQITTSQAMWLMADNLSGCQTVMIRYQNGVALLHSEEDYDDMSLHMTGEKVVSFDDKGQVSKCIVYNDLMPGAGLYGWKENLLVAVDTLFLREDEIENVSNPLLANVVAWIVWRMKAELAEPNTILKLVQDLGELIDGYAINVVRKVQQKTEGYKLTLARTESKIEYLGESAGDYLRQVNIVDPEYPKMKWVSPPRRMWRGGYKHFLARLKRIDSDVAKYIFVAQMYSGSDTVVADHNLIQKTIYTELGEAYINENVGAVCVGLIDNNQTSVSVKLTEGKPFETVEYIDLC